MGNVELGIGLIGIGREWGRVNKGIPSEAQSIDLLKHAINLGIRLFDTAPAYGLSEERLGLFLKSVDENKRNSIIVATKFGEHWDKQSATTYVDHSFKMLQSSIDSSLLKLGKIDLLQIHRTNSIVLGSMDLKRAIEYAKSRGIRKIGASIVDELSGQIACENDSIDYIQLPFHRNNDKLRSIIRMATERDKKIIINRPFDTGNLIVDKLTTNSQSVIIDCFEFILQNEFMGFILTGTKSIRHLTENAEAFSASL